MVTVFHTLKAKYSMKANGNQAKSMVMVNSHLMTVFTQASFAKTKNQDMAFS